MKKKKWLESMNLVEEKYVEEADPTKATAKKRRRRIGYGSLAACLCCAILAGSLYLLVPFSTTPPDVSRYSESDYYDLIQTLNQSTYQKPEYANNLERLVALLENSFGGVGKAEDAVDYDYTSEAEGATNLAASDSLADTDYRTEEGYQETTDNQVSGVIEGDLIKRSDKYIYYLDKSTFTLTVYTIAGEQSEQVGGYTMPLGAGFPLVDNWEFYLSEDCKTATVIISQYADQLESDCVTVLSLDVGDPAKIVEKNTFTITGTYLSSRLVEGKLLLLTCFGIDPWTVDFSKEETFLPQTDSGTGMTCIPAQDIVCPDTLSNTSYTVVTKLDEKTLAVEGNAAYLSYSEDVYVSRDNLFLTRAYTDQKKEGSITTNTSMTEISCLSYGAGEFENKGSLTVEGYVNNQYSMDEYEGVLRVVTTTSTWQTQETVWSNGSVSADTFVGTVADTNANLYAIRISDGKTLAQVTAFAPAGETVQSVRFDGTAAYVCTSVQLSDPVFFFDLSDYSNITWKDSGTIDGFSSSLVNFGDGYLLGIGVGDSWGFKVEIYKETADGVASVCKYELENAYYSTDYKSYYIDRERQLIGLGILDYENYRSSSNESDRYLLLHFDGGSLQELFNKPLRGEPGDKRGVYIDGYFYLLGYEDFKVIKLF